MTAETQEESGPDLDWMTAQPYDAWAEVRRSECPVMNAGVDIMGPGTGTFFQVAAYKDADAVLFLHVGSGLGVVNSEGITSPPNLARSSAVAGRVFISD